jgi:c-di-GMP-binding flagellar brake protein YcgR
MRLPGWQLRQRRRDDRRYGRWEARYRPEHAPRWNPCHVVDLSLGGAALELPTTVEQPDGRLEVDIRPGREGVEGFVLRGQVRYVLRNRRREPRVGVEFDEMSEIERHVLNDLMSLESA